MSTDGVVAAGCETTQASVRAAWSRTIVIGKVLGILLKSPAFHNIESRASPYTNEEL